MKYFFAAAFVALVILGLVCSIAEAGYFYGLIFHWVNS